MVRCTACGSANVQMLAWVNANTHEYVEDDEYSWQSHSSDHFWCEDCGELRVLVDSHAMPLEYGKALALAAKNGKIGLEEARTEYRRLTHLPLPNAEG